MPRILIADDHQMFIDGLRSILDKQNNIEIVAEALNGVQAVKMAGENNIDLVLMDVNMPKLNGIEAARTIKEQFPNVKILLLTMYGTRDFIEKALEINVDGYILKNTGKEELMTAIATLMRNEKFYSEEVKNSFMGSFARKTSNVQEVHISKREVEVLKLVAQELTTAQIADKLFISHHTVDTHRKNLLSKLGLKNAAGLVKFAMQKGYI
jgi:DNA-binding NarL/FixJ family response regulator